LGVGIADENKDDDERVIVLILTDGEENASKQTSRERVREIIKSHENEGDWSFIYVGASPSKWKEDSGTVADNAMKFTTPTFSCSAASLGISNLRNSQMSQSNDIFAN
jgi:hypothetical protein